MNLEHRQVNQHVKSDQSLFNWLLRVPATNSQQEFRARTAAVIAIVLLISFVLGATLILSNRRPRESAFALVLCASCALILYALNRRNYYRTSAIVEIGLCIIAPLSVIALNPTSLMLLGLMALVTTISVPVTLTLLPGRRNALVVVAIGTTAYLVVPPSVAAYSLPQAFYFACGIAVLGLIWIIFDQFQARLGSEHESNMREKADALQSAEAALRQQNQRLRQELEDSAIELEATVHEFMLAKEETDQARSEAERANNVKSAFLAHMSHELRTPLNAIINYSKFVAKGSMGPVNEEQEETLYEVVDSAKHLLQLINDVLDMSKIDSGSLTLFVENDVNLHPIIDSVISMGKALLADKQVALESLIAPDLPPIKGDRQRILQILLNIVSNACKFTEKGQIKLEAKRSQDEVILSVEDTGPGIAPEDHEKVFEAFKQTSTGLRQVGGTGLGMPISKNLAEAHGGRLWLESVIGKGTVFHVALPINSEKLAAISAP